MRPPIYQDTLTGPKGGWIRGSPLYCGLNFHPPTYLKYEDHIECNAERITLHGKGVPDEFPLVHAEFEFVSQHERAGGEDFSQSGRWQLAVVPVNVITVNSL